MQQQRPSEDLLLPATKSEAFEQLRFHIFEAGRGTGTEKADSTFAKISRLIDALQEMVNAESLQHSELKTEMAELKVKLEVRDIENQKLKEDFESSKTKAGSTIHVRHFFLFSRKKKH